MANQDIRVLGELPTYDINSTGRASHKSHVSFAVLQLSNDAFPVCYAYLDLGIWEALSKFGDKLRSKIASCRYHCDPNLIVQLPPQGGHDMDRLAESFGQALGIGDQGCRDLGRLNAASVLIELVRTDSLAKASHLHGDCGTGQRKFLRSSDKAPALDGRQEDLHLAERNFRIRIVQPSALFADTSRTSIRLSPLRLKATHLALHRFQEPCPASRE